MTATASLAARQRLRSIFQALMRAGGMLARTRSAQKARRVYLRSTSSRLPATACQPRDAGGAGTQAGFRCPRRVATHSIIAI